MYSVFIGDDNENWLNILSNGINKEPDYKVVAKAGNGKTSIEVIEELRPDIVMLDIIMPEYDGVYIVNHIRTGMNDYNPIIYILSGLGTDTIIRVLNELHVDYYSLKPVSIEVVVHNLGAMVNKRYQTGAVPEAADSGLPARHESIEECVKGIVRRFGIVPNRVSTHCLVDALIYCLAHLDSDYMLTKTLYPEVAKKHGLNSSSVERNIRHAISQIEKNQSELFRRIFAYSPSRKLTNSEFLSVVTDYIGRMEKQL